MAQNLFANAYGGDDADYAYSIIQTSDGGFAVAGCTESSGAGGYDLLVLKLNSDGSVAWAKVMGGTLSDLPSSIVQTSDGGYAIAGVTESFGAGGFDFLVIKLNSDGSLAWAKAMGGKSYDYAESVICPSDGSCMVVGWTESFGAGGSDFLVIKLNSDGSVAWAKTIGDTLWDLPSSIVQTSDGGYAIAGVTESFGAGGDDFLVLKLNSDGSVAWARTMGDTASEEALSITQTSDGGCAVVGWTQSFGAGNWDVLVLKLGADGSYPGCVEDCSPSVDIPSLGESSPTPDTSSPSVVEASCTLNVMTPNLIVTDACEPSSGLKELFCGGERLSCSGLRGGLLFNSPSELKVRIYSVDGRLVYLGRLRKGENRIDLERGVYLWQAGPYRGKALVR